MINNPHLHPLVSTLLIHFGVLVLAIVIVGAYVLLDTNRQQSGWAYDLLTILCGTLGLLVLGPVYVAIALFKLGLETWQIAEIRRAGRKQRSQMQQLYDDYLDELLRR